MDFDHFHHSPHSRRSFLKLGAAATVAAAPLGGSGLLADDAPADGSAEYGGLVVGLQSYTLRHGSLEESLGAMRKDLKVHAVEFFPPHLAGSCPARVKDLLAAHGVRALSYGIIPFTRVHETNRTAFELAGTYGMTNLSCDPDPDAFDSLERLTDEYGMTVAIHPTGPGHRWGTTRQLTKAFAGRSDRIGLCMDTGHIIRAGEDPLEVMRHFKDRLHAIHLKDFKKAVAGGTWQDVPAGTANLDVDGVVRFLIDAKCRAPVFIEYEGGDPLPSAKRSLDRIKRAVKKAKVRDSEDRRRGE